jgi:hypothetical protein
MIISTIPCARTGGTTVSLPILGQKGRALIKAGWRVEARDDGDLYILRLVHPTNENIGYAAQGQTWAMTWQALEWTIKCLGEDKAVTPRQRGGKE